MGGHVLVAMTEPREYAQVLRLNFRRMCAVGFERARGLEQITVECAMQPSEQRLKGSRIACLKQLQQLNKATLRFIAKYCFHDELAVFQEIGRASYRETMGTTV